MSGLRRELDLGLRLTDDGIASLWATFAMNAVVDGGDHDRAGERGAERRAEVRHHVLDAADLGLSSSGTADTVTAPSCEARAPIPRPIRSMGTRTIPAVGRRGRPAGRPSGGAAASRPPRTTRRWERHGPEPRMPIAAASSVTDSGRSRAPVSSADRPRADREEERHDEEAARLRQVLEEEHRPARRSAACCAASRPARAALRPAASTRASSGRRARSRAAPPGRATPSATARPTPARRASAGSSPTRPSGARRRRAARGRAPRAPGADDVQPRTLLHRRVGDPPGEQQDQRHEHDLAREHRRQEKYVVQKPPMSGPTATATPGRGSDGPYAAGRRSAAKFPATSATIAGRIRAAPDAPRGTTSRSAAS